MNSHDNETIRKRSESIPQYFFCLGSVLLRCRFDRAALLWWWRKKGQVNLDRCLINGVCACHFLVSISSNANYIFRNYYFSFARVDWCPVPVLSSQLHLIVLNASNIQLDDCVRTTHVTPGRPLVIAIHVKCQRLNAISTEPAINVRPKIL